jgi:hypothetical protein
MLIPQSSPFSSSAGLFSVRSSLILLLGLSGGAVAGTFIYLAGEHWGLAVLAGLGVAMRLSRSSLNFVGLRCDQAATTGSLWRVELMFSVATWRWRA